MSITLSTAVQAEVRRLARLLRCEPVELTYLTRFDHAELRSLRLAVGRRMHDNRRHAFGRIARMSRLLPPRLLASAAERLLPPRSCAGVVAALPAGTSADVAQRMSPAYLCEVSSHLAPEVIDHVVGRLPDHVVLAVAAELVSREDYDAMAEIVGALKPAQFADVLTQVGDAGTLVQVALRITDPEAIHRLGDALPEQHLLEMVRWGRRRPRLWPELLPLLGRLPKSRQAALLTGRSG